MGASPVRTIVAAWVLAVATASVVQARTFEFSRGTIGLTFDAETGSLEAGQWYECIVRWDLDGIGGVKVTVPPRTKTISTANLGPP